MKDLRLFCNAFDCNRPASQDVGIMRYCDSHAEARRPLAEACRQSFYQDVVNLALCEAREAARTWPRYNSAHEGFAILKEEVDELWDHVKTNPNKRDLAAMKKEAIQVAAVAIRFAAEVCDEERGRK